METTYGQDGGRGDTPTLTRPSGTLSHPMGEGRGEGPGGRFPRMLGRVLFCACVLTWVAPIQAAVPASGLERLQQLTRLPQLSFGLGLTFTGTGGFEFLGSAPDPARGVEELRQRLAEAPADPSLYARLARLLASVNESQLAERASAQAAQLYEQQNAAESRDPSVLVAYGEVLRDQQKFPQAEQVMRRAVELAHTNWLPHAALARFLAGTAMRSLAGTVSMAELLVSPQAPRPDASRVQQAEQLMQEALREAQRAVELGPVEPDAFATRASVATSRRLLDYLVAQTAPGESDPTARSVAVNRAIFHREAVPDIWSAARLAPDDPTTWGTAAMLDLLAEAFERGLRQVEDLLTGDVWPLMPETTRERVREALTRLATLGQSPQPRAAAAALTLLGTLQFFVLRDTAGGEASLRRATDLDPAASGAWEAWTFALAYSRRFDDLVGVCQARLKHADSLRNRVLLAKAYEKTQQPDAMLAELERARQRHPDALLANLALGAALLKTSTDDAARTRALPFLARATQLAGESPPREVALEVAFQRGLYFALSGQRTVARTHFRQALELDPENAEAAEALRAIEQLGE